MFELIKAGENTYYIQSPVNIGVYVVNDRDAYLIDSGSDKIAGKKILKHFSERGWALKAIFNTHSHADHIGANAYLKEQTGCQVYLPDIECAFAQKTLLEPTMLYGGCPPKDLRHHFLMAKEHLVLPLTEPCLPQGLHFFPLPGHSFSMVGYYADDGTVFLGDALLSEETLNKYQIGYLYDIKAHLETLAMLKQLKGEYFIPCHATPGNNMLPLICLNEQKIHEITEKILFLCQKPVVFEELLADVFTQLSLTMVFEQYALVGSTLRSYLAYLKDEGRLTVLIENNRLLWKTVEE